EAGGVQDAEAEQGVEGLQGVAEELAAVVDAGEAAHAAEVVAEDLAPHPADLMRLGKEPVPAHVEAVAAVLLGARQAADDVALLPDAGPPAEAAELRGG